MKRTKRSERKDKHLSEWTETEENTTSRQSSSHRNNINQTISQLRNSQNWLIKCQWSRQCNCHLTGHCFCFCLPMNFRTIFEIFSEHEKKWNQNEKKMFELHKWQWIHRIESNRNTKNRKQNSLTRHETISIAAKQHRINIFSKLIGIRCDGSFRLKLKKKRKNENTVPFDANAKQAWNVIARRRLLSANETKLIWKKKTATVTTVETMATKNNEMK